jgi:hypothetical protein
MTTNNTITAKAAALLDELRARREANAAHRQLRRELASYSTPSQIDDLMVAVDGVEDDGAAEVRHILHHNLQDFYRARNAS